MADIFISYARADRDRIEKLAAALESEGYTVWWDRRIVGGSEFSAEIERQIEEAKVVIVAWSKHAITSEWVRDEAAQARDDGKLLPVQLDDSRPPMGFRQRQAINLQRWPAHDFEQGMAELTGSIEASMSSDHVLPARAASSPRPNLVSRYRFVASGIAILIVAGVLLLFLFRAGPEDNGVTKTDQAAKTDVVIGRISMGDFRAIGEDQGLTVLADSISTNLASNLADYGIEIAAANSGAGADSQSEFALQGVVEEDETFLRVHLDFVRLSSGATLWSETFERPNGERSSIRDDIASKTVSVMTCAYENRANEKNGLTDDLFRLYLRYCDANRDLHSITNISAFTEDILRAAPQSMNAMALHAYVLSQRGRQSFSEEEFAARREEAKKLAETVLETDPENIRAGHAMGALVSGPGKWAETERWLKPLTGSSNAGIDASFAYANILRMVGRYDEAENLYRRIVAVDPLHPLAHLNLAWLIAMDGNVDEAHALIDESERYAPAGLDMVTFRRFQIDLYYGAPADALARLDPAAGSQLPFPPPVRDCFAAYAGAREQATPDLDALDQVCARMGASGRVRIFANLGDRDRAFREAEKLDPSDYSVTILFFLPEWRQLRQDPRFMPFAEKFGLVDYWLETEQWPDFCADQMLPYNCEEAALSAKANGQSGSLLTEEQTPKVQ